MAKKIESAAVADRETKTTSSSASDALTDTQTILKKHEVAREPTRSSKEPMPEEASIVTLPADATAGANRNPKLSSSERKEFALLRKVIRTGASEMFKRHLEVGAAILTIKEKQLYREKYNNLEEFCAAEFNIAKTRAYELWNAAKVLRDFSAMAEKVTLPANERQIRPLIKLKEQHQRAEAWQKAITLASGQPVTEAHVRKAVNQIQKGTDKRLAETLPVAPELEIPDWKSGIIAKFKTEGYESVFEQPLKWPSDVADLYSPIDDRYLKLIGELTLGEAACAIALKRKAPAALIIINADANAPDGILLSKAGDIVETFPPSFNVMAKQLAAVLEDEGVFYEAGDLDEFSETTWHPVANADLAQLASSNDRSGGK